MLLAGCDIEVTVDAAIEPDGSGLAGVTVLFDQEAVDLLTASAQSASTDAAEEAPLDPLVAIAAVVDVDDLTAAGWQIHEPTLMDDGAVELSATKPVVSADAWQGVLDEIAGPGVFTDVQITGTDAPDERRRTLAFDVDLSQGPALVFDAETTAALDGQPLGRPLRQLTNGRPIDEAVAIIIRADLASSDGDAASGQWRPRFNQAAPLPIRLVSTTAATASVVFRWIAGALASLAVLAALLAVVRTVLERRARALAARELEQEQASKAAAAEAAAAAQANGRRGRTGTSASTSFVDAVQPEAPIRLVIVDPLTVLFQQSKPVGTYVIPYVRHNRGAAADDEIVAAHREVIQGRMPTEALWKTSGVEGDGAVIDEVYCEMRWLRPGARDFLTQFSDRRIPVAGLSNDSAVWSNFVRQRERLTAVWPWMVSSDEGLLKPDPAIFERLGQAIEVPWEQCLYVDTDPASLAVAQGLGMRTTFFDPDGLGPDAALGHPRVQSFEGFFRRQLR